MTIAGIVVVALVAVLPAAVQFLPLGNLNKWLLLILEWPLLIGFVVIGLNSDWCHAYDATGNVNGRTSRGTYLNLPTIPFGAL